MFGKSEHNMKKRWITNTEKHLNVSLTDSISNCKTDAQEERKKW
jgi:hypothetical protein